MININPNDMKMQSIKSGDTGNMEFIHVQWNSFTSLHRTSMVRSYAIPRRLCPDPIYGHLIIVR